MARHFPFQHPLFGSKRNPISPDNPKHWSRTVYYWWWEYLRRHDGYKKCCLRGGTGPFSRLYQYFGDVHTGDFKSWWSEGDRCVRLFAEPKSAQHFSVVSESISADDLANPNVLYLQVPLNFPKRRLKQWFHAALEKHHDGRQGKQYARQSHATYRVIGQPNIHALRVTLELYDLRMAEPETPFWQLLSRLRLFHSEQTVPSLDERNLAAAMGSRYMRKAKAMIENVGKGFFPAPYPIDDNGNKLAATKTDRKQES